MRRLGVLLLWLWLVAPAWSAPLAVEAEISPSTAPFGSTLRLVVDLSVEPDQSFEPPPPEKLKVEGFEVRDAVLNALPKEGGRDRYRYTLKLARYEPGDFKIPALTFQLGQARVSTRELPVKLTGSTPKPGDKEGQIRDLKAYDPMPIPIWVYLLLMAVAAGLLGLGWRLGKLLARRQAEKPAPPPEPAHVIALRRLEELEKERLLENNRGQEFADRLSAILRSYLAARFSIPVLERTTSELLADLRRGDYDEELRRDVKTVLGLADLAKFAKREPDQEEGRTELRRTRALIVGTQAEESTDAPG